MPSTCCCCRREGRVTSSLHAFSTTTGLHGYVYLADPRHRCEVAFWAAVCALAFLITAFLVNQMFAQWSHNVVSTV